MHFTMRWSLLQELANMLDNLETEAMHRKRILQEQLTSDPLLTIVQLQVTTM